MFWVEYFLSTPIGRYFCRVDQEYLQSKFNHYNLNNYFADYEAVFRYMLSSKDRYDQDSQEYKDAVKLYGMIHARFILTKNGLKYIANHYRESVNLPCPRVYCKKYRCFPYGPSEVDPTQPTHLFCPNCSDVYVSTDPLLSRIPGIYFGPTYVHMLLKFIPNTVPPVPPRCYVPKIYGFQLCFSDDEEKTPE